MGAAAMDTVVQVNAFPKTDDIVYPNEVLRVPGGSAANVAVALARLGADVSFLGTIGADADGQAVEQAFHNEHVDTTHLIRIVDGRTAGAFIAVDSKGERVMYSLGGDAIYTEVSQLTGVDFTADALYIAEVFAEIGVFAASRVRECGGKVFFAPGGVMCSYGLEELRPLIACSDAMFVSLAELSALTGRQDTASGSAILLAAGTNAVIITQGSRGASIYTQYGSLFVEANAVKAIDTTGAGDSFAAAYLFSELRGDEPSTRLAFANRCAAFTVTRLGARTSPRLSEIEP